jgi:hypothetical protein
MPVMVRAIVGAFDWGGGLDLVAAQRGLQQVFDTPPQLALQQDPTPARKPRTSTQRLVQ